MMNLKTVKIVKTVSDDGLIAMRDDVPLGRQYIVDLDTSREWKLFNKDREVEHNKMMVSAVHPDTNEPDGLLPCEFIEMVE